jgi:diaminopimelate epimerase
MRFAKYHALGNDYVVCDAADWPRGFSEDAIRRICDRHFGIGSDGILWGPLPVDAAPFGLRIYNPDGSEAQKSGNGLRIFCRYLFDEGKVAGAPFDVWTLGGVVRAQVLEGGASVEVEMGRVRFDTASIPMTGPAREAIDEEMKIGAETLRFTAASIGNPHCVIRRDRAEAADALRLGPLIERDARFPERTNVQFLEVMDAANIRIEIWERGAGHTMASGSSSCASAAVAHRMGWVGSDVTVHMPGGSLAVRIGEDYAITMRGPVVKVGEGRLSPELFEGLPVL